MKKLKTLAILLLIITALHYSAKGQTYKVPIPNTNSHWVFQSLDDNKLVATLHKDTLFVHKPSLIKIKEQSTELRYLHWKGRTYRYRYAYYDRAYMFAGIKGKKIY